MYIYIYIVPTTRAASNHRPARRIGPAATLVSLSLSIYR